MGDGFITLLKAFGFKELHTWIAVISALLFSFNLLGGILTGLMVVNSSRLVQRPLKERISFRLFLLSEIMLLIFVLYYHTFMIETISTSHIIYWCSAVMIMPLLAIIGSQTIQVIYSGRTKAKQEAHKRQQQAERAKRTQEMEQSGGATPGLNPAERAMAARKGK